MILILVLACAVVNSSVMIVSLEAEPTMSEDEPATPPGTDDTQEDAGAEPDTTDEPEPEDEDEPEDEPEEEPDPSAEYFTIAMMGDCTFASDHDSREGPHSYEVVVGDDYAYPFGMVKHLYDDADFVIVNLESAMCEYNVPVEKLFRLRAKPEYVNILLEGGVDFVALGNNHTMDYGQTGYEETQEVLSGNGIGFAPNGGWRLFTTESGLTIGVYSKNMASESDVTTAISELKAAGAELLIMALHWGDEGSYRANADQKLVGRAAIDAGAHIVMGTHPHTVQEFEIYNGGFIYYSLGNWSFGGHTNPRDKDSILARVMVMRDIDGQISIIGADNIPCSVSGSETTNDYQPTPYEIGSEEYERTLSKLDGTFSGPNLVVSYQSSTDETDEQLDGGHPVTGEDAGDGGGDDNGGDASDGDDEAADGNDGNDDAAGDDGD